MTPQHRWTHDHKPNQHYTPPWYQLEPLPYWVSKPSARMEKQSAQERGQQRMYQKDDNHGDAIREACWLPCVVYARTAKRLRALISGQDPSNVHNESCCSTSCLACLVCLPCYGLLYAKLQGTVRAYYNINGTNISDWIDGCCCPCRTLVRNEKEIMLRQNQQSQVKDLNGRESSSIMEPYRSISPMESPVISSSASHNTTQSTSHGVSHGALQNASHGIAATPDAVGASVETGVLAPIPELIPEAPPVSRLQRDPSQPKLKSKEVGDEEKTSSTADGEMTISPSTHLPNQDTVLAPTADKSEVQDMGSSVDSITNLPKIKTSHEPGHDETTSTNAAPAKDPLTELNRLGAPTRPKGPSASSSRHDIHHDQILIKPRPATSHELHDDVMATPPSRGGAGTPHQLDSDRQSWAQSVTRKLHQLRDEKR